MVCKISVPKVLEMVSNITKKVNALKEEVETIKDRVSNLEVKDATDIDNLKSTIAKECKEVIRHENDRVRRLNNVNIFGLAESSLNTADEKISADKDRIQSILAEELGLPTIVPAKVIRLCPKVPNPARTSPIPVKVVLNSPADRSAILLNAKKLANPKIPQNKVYISP